MGENESNQIPRPLIAPPPWLPATNKMAPGPPSSERHFAFCVFLVAGINPPDKLPNKSRNPTEQQDLSASGPSRSHRKERPGYCLSDLAGAFSASVAVVDFMETT